MQTRSSPRKKRADQKSMESTDEVKQLSFNALRDISVWQKSQEIRDSHYVLQVIEVKVFNNNDNKKNIKQRIHLSDGTSIVIAMITDKIDTAMQGQSIPKFSIIKVKGDVQVNKVQGKTVLVFKSAPEILYTGLERTIGNPDQLEKNQADASRFENEVDLTIPLGETDQNKKSLQSAKSEQKSTSSGFDQQQTNTDSPAENRAASKSSAAAPANQKLSEAQLDRIRQQASGSKTSKAVYTPIKSLNTFLFEWKIKARVTKKHAKKTWKNARNQGTLLNVELIDSQGTQIQATFFNDQAEQYDKELVENKVYLFANGQVKMANQKYTSIKNDYSIIFDKKSEVTEAEEDSSIKSQGFCFTNIEEINEFEQMRTIDAIGVITAIGQITQINIKQSGAVKDRRNVTIVDESTLQIQVSLWGANANKSGYTEGQVLALRGARVSDYGGKSLNSGDEHSQMFIDPDHKRARELIKWYEKNSQNKQSFNSVSHIQQPQSNSQGGNSGSGYNAYEKFDNFKLSEELVREVQQDMQMNGQQSWNEQPSKSNVNKTQIQNNASKFCKVSGYIKKVMGEEKLLYLSCPICRKKVIEDGDNKWRCESCNKTHDTNLPTYMLCAIFSDISGDVFVQFPRELGDPIMNGLSAPEFKQLKEESCQSGDLDFMQEFLQSKCQFKQHQILLKTQNQANFQTSTNETKMKFFAAKVLPYSFQDENKLLLKRLNAYKDKIQRKSMSMQI